MAKKQKPTFAEGVDGLGWTGHVVPALFGVLAIVAAFYAWKTGIQVTLGVSLVIAGGLLPWIAWMSLAGSRAAWSFLISLCIVFGIMTLFGAPKIRDLVGIPLGVALVIPGLFGFSAFALSLLDRRYKNQG